MARFRQYVSHSILRSVTGFGSESGFFGLFTSCDVLHHSLVVEELTGVFIAHGARIFRDPNDASIAPVNLRLEGRDHSVAALSGTSRRWSPRYRSRRSAASWRP